MHVALPCKRQPYQLLANIFAAAENLQKDEKRLAPVLENEKSRGFAFKFARLFYFWRVLCMKGGDAMI
jgi:hypothetical protein